MARDPAEVGAIAVSYDHQISDGRILRFHVGIAEDAASEEFNALLDKLTAAGDRQAAKYQLEALQHHLKRDEKLYLAREKELIRVDAEQEAEYNASPRKMPWGPDRLTAKQKTERQQVLQNRSIAMESIVEQRNEIARLTKVVNGAAHIPANSS